MGTHLSELSSAYSSMSTACSDYAQHLDDAHSQIIDELVSLLEWTAVLEAGGGLLAVFTVGASEVAANAALAARCAVVAARVGGILGRLIELAGEVAQTIVNALARVIEISRKLKTLLGATLSRATATAVARLRGVTETAEEVATDGLKAAAETSRSPMSTGCFVAGTMVVTVDGLQPIENLAVGDKVVAGDPIAATQQVHPITAIFIHTVPVVLDLCVEGTRITCSPEHPLWVLGTGWRHAGTLHVGDSLLTQKGRPTQIDSVERRRGAFTVYNIEVAGIHTTASRNWRLLHTTRLPRTPTRNPRRGREGRRDRQILQTGRKAICRTRGSRVKILRSESWTTSTAQEVGQTQVPHRNTTRLKKYGDRHFE
ncbi:MAG: polymorphic toxin-type HINT domain-containing protein [Pseudonocardiaceae bacterium]